ncbi:glycosyltransferase 87 family protein [Winogradskya consettensis]|uniref:glycosyltransferase 87 family protein n=1 Tax=Winogradskya consettensis TaxID=113560 RepID=UPI001BB348DA|nr:glycosyltransferase 87 family protein [Actinoplanes consettensis]
MIGSARLASVRLPERIDQAAGGLAADAALYGLSAVFALVTALTSTLLPHRAWGTIAAWGYLAAFLITSTQLILRRPAARTGLTWLAWAATALLPLVVEAVQRATGRTDRAQEEVLVVEHMGERLAHTGTPYLSRDAISALPSGDQLLGYAPYQPGMAVFGLPRAALGDFWFTDARIWFALVTAGALVTAVRLLTTSTVRALQFATVLPLCALTLATGGDDLPVLALSLLALAFAGRGRFVAAGVAVGAAASLKLFAFPVLAVLLVLAITRKDVRRFLPGALGLPILTLLPALLVHADAFVENVLRFPLGHGVVTSPAQSPFPGYLIAQALPGGRYVAIGLLFAAGLAIAVRLIQHPPHTAATAALFCGYGLLAATLLMPTTRFGYLLYPLAFLVWAPALGRREWQPARLSTG